MASGDDDCGPAAETIASIVPSVKSRSRVLARVRHRDRRIGMQRRRPRRTESWLRRRAVGVATARIGASIPAAVSASEAVANRTARR